MTKIENVKVRLSDGRVKTLNMRVSCDAPWTLEFEILDGGSLRIEASDLFEALRDARKELELVGAQLLCAGARPDVTPSGMSRDMSGGRKAYKVTLGNPAGDSDMVDIFDYAELEVVGSLRQQNDYIGAWTASIRQRHRF